MNCPYCNNILSENKDICIECNNEIYYCDSCNNLIKYEDEKCPHCGADLTEENNEQNLIISTKKEFYSSRSIFITTFFGGPLAGLYLMIFNFFSLKEKAKAKKLIIFGSIIVLIFTFGIFLLPNNNFPYNILANLTCALFYYLTKHLQESKYKNFITNNTKKPSIWKNIIVAIISFILYLILSGLIAILFFKQGEWDSKILKISDISTAYKPNIVGKLIDKNNVVYIYGGQGEFKYALGEPKGWIYEDKICDKYNMEPFFYKANDTIDRALNTIFISIMNIPKDKFNEFIEQEINTIPNNYPNTNISSLDDIITNDNKTAKVIYYKIDKNNYISASIPMKKIVCYITLICADESQYNSGKKALNEIIESLYEIK